MKLGDDLDRAVLERRAERLALPAAREEAGGGDLVAKFQLGDAFYAFPLARMRAIVPLRSVTAVPLAPRGVLGVVRWRRRIITAFSLPALLGGAAWRSDAEVLLVVELAPDHHVAVDCAEIPRSVALAENAIDRATPRAPGVDEVALGDGGTVLLLDLSRLVKRAIGHGA